MDVPEPQSMARYPAALWILVCPRGKNRGLAGTRKFLADTRTVQRPEPDDARRNGAFTLEGGALLAWRKRQGCSVPLQLESFYRSSVPGGSSQRHHCRVFNRGGRVSGVQGPAVVERAASGGGRTHQVRHARTGSL